MAGLSKGGGGHTYGPGRAVHGARPAPSPGATERRGSAPTARSQEDFRSAYAAAGVAMARLTRQGRIIDVNQSFGRLVGRPAAELAGRRLLDLVHADDAAALRAGKLSSLTAGTVLAELRFKSGEDIVWGKATIKLARRADDVPDSLILTVEDLSALKSREAALERAKVRDPATGLANATLLASRLARSIATARRAGRKLALLVIEIDRFAAIDERQGPGAAQRLLANMAGRLQDRVRPSDSVARTSGNEVAVILGKVDEAELAAGVGRRLLATLEPEFHLDDAGFQVKISMGVAVFPEDGRTPEALLRRARLDMYLGELSEPAGRAPRSGGGAADRTTAAAPRTALPGGAGAGKGGSGAGDGGSGTGALAPAGSAPTQGEATSTSDAAATGLEVEPAEIGEDLARRVDVLEPVSLFLSLPDRVLRRIARYMSEQAARAGEEVAGPTSPAALRIIHEGTMEVRSEREGESISLLTLGPGDFMGVDSLFSDDPVPVHLRALTECKLLVLEGEMVARAAPPGSAFREALRVAAGQRDNHLRALLNRPHQAATGSDATQVAVYSTKGGSGRTTLALNLGAELGRRHPGEVLVVDLALPYNHIALLGNLSPSTCLARIGKAPDANFSALAWSAVLPHPAGFMALPATLRPEEAELVTPELLLRAMKVLAPQFRYIVFDLGVALDDCVLATLEMSDHLVLVATPELASMHDTRQMIDLATRVLHIPVGRVHTVLNHRSPDSLLGRQVVEDVLGQPLAAEFRYFGTGPEMAGLEGKLQVQSDPGGHFSRSIRAILDRVIDLPAAKDRSA
jgi:diguanylate cyclase (GGDEF)-like protein/PAS domain S-box-containing protein